MGVTLNRNETIDPALVAGRDNRCSHQFCTLIDNHASPHADVSTSGFIFEILDDEPAPEPVSQPDAELDF